MKDILIRTDRFILKSLIKEDVNERYLDWINGPNRSEYIVNENQERSIDDLCSYVEGKLLDEYVLFLGIFELGNENHIGNIKYEPIDLQRGFAIMGILIGEEDWKGKGVATEVIEASSKWLNKKYKTQKIILGVDRNNINAIKAYQKCGFNIEDTPYIESNSESGVTMVWDMTQEQI